MHRHRLLPLGLVLIAATACQDTTPLTPTAPVAPRFAVSGGATTDLRAGADYVCLLRGGAVNCFGSTSQGQPHGMHHAATGTFVGLTAGATHACALRSDGAVECFGSNLYGEAPPLVHATTGSFTQVSAGVDHTCALRSDGALECWGSNTEGQAPPVIVPQTGAFTYVSANAFRTCALRTDGVVECRGFRFESPSIQNSPSGAYAKLGESVGSTTCLLRSTLMLECWGNQASFYQGPYASVVVGASHVCVLNPDSTARCSGYPYSYETSETRSVAGRAWTRITAGTDLTCGLRPDAYFECFGAIQTIGSNAPDVIPDSSLATASIRSGVARLDWRDVNSNELRTEIQRSVADDAGQATTWTAVGSVTANFAAFYDRSAAPGATYLYRTRVCNNAGCSGWTRTNPLRFPNGRPPAPAVTASGYVCGYSSCIKVAWTEDITYVDSFRVQRRVKSGSTYGEWAEVARRGRESTQFDDYGLKPGTSYQYRVAACNILGCSGYATGPVVVPPMPPPPPAPASLSAYRLGYAMHLVWGDVANETYYELQRRQSDGSTWTDWSAPVWRALNDTNDDQAITPGTLYQWRIHACNQGGCSAYTYSDPTQA